jgi:hypothetical protein
MISVVFLLFNSACLSDQTVSFIPVFAEEGMKLNVGGDGMRGGLLREDCEDYSGGSALKEISCNNTYISGAESEYYDTRDSRTLNVIKRLRKIGLIEKEDIRKYNLLCESCNEWSSKRFNYFADWNDHVVETVRGGGVEHYSRYLHPAAASPLCVQSLVNEKGENHPYPG